MTYNKPEFVTLETPIKAIQGSLHKGGTKMDGTTDPNDPNYGLRNATVTAYEADE